MKKYEELDYVEKCNLDSLFIDALAHRLNTTQREELIVHVAYCNDNPAATRRIINSLERLHKRQIQEQKESKGH